MPKKRKYTKAGKAEADKAVDFIRNWCHHTKGEWAGKNFSLLPWQEDEIIRPLFGTLTDGGIRQYRTVYIEVPKKNGKSELAAAVALKLMGADQEPGAEVYCAAADRFQAGLVSSVAIDMVEYSPQLSARCKPVEYQKRIIFSSSDGTKSVLITLSAEAYTKHGMNPHGVIFDELHTQKTRELWDTLTFGADSARRQPVLFVITTAGYDRNSICWEQHDYALRVLKHNNPDQWKWVQGAAIDDPTFLPIIYAAKDDDDWTDQETWRQVNPSLDHIFDLSRLEIDFRKAQATPALENIFRRFRLNQWVKQSVRWMNMEAWDACNLSPIKPRRLRGRTCYCGLDLSSNTDLSTLVSVFPPANDSGPYDVHCHFFIPEDNIAERVRRDHVPYDVWVRDGLIIATPGNVIDYRYILQTIIAWGEHVEIAEIPYDRWGATKLVQDLMDEGVIVVPFGQGFASMSGPTKDLETLVLSRQLNHGGNPVLRWMADNVSVRTDPAGNLKPDKEKSTERIDGIVGLVMGLGRAMLGESSSHSVYEDRGLLTVEMPAW